MMPMHPCGGFDGAVGAPYLFALFLSLAVLGGSADPSAEYDFVSSPYPIWRQSQSMSSGPSAMTGNRGQKLLDEELA